MDINRSVEHSVLTGADVGGRITLKCGDILCRSEQDSFITRNQFHCLILIKYQVLKTCEGVEV